MARNRDATLARILGESRRRKRRNLKRNEGAALGAVTIIQNPGGGGGDARCPNIGPPEAADVFRTLLAEGSVKGHVYTEVEAEDAALICGADVLSFCFMARVGDETTSEETGCSGTLGLISSGIVSRPVWRQGSLPEGWYEDEHDGRVLYERKDGVRTLKTIQDAEGRSTVKYAAPDPSKPVRYIQANLCQEGCYSVRAGGGGVSLDSPPCPLNAGVVDHQYTATKPIIGIGDIFGWYGQGGNLFVNVRVNYLAKGNGHPSFLALDTQSHAATFFGTAQHFWSGEGWSYWGIHGSDSIITHDPLYADQSSGGDAWLGLDNWSAEPPWADPGKYPDYVGQSGLYNWGSQDVGNVWWYNVALMTHKDVFFRGIPTGYYVRLKDGPGPYESMTSFAGAPASGELQIKPDNRSYLADGDGSWANWSCDYPRYTFELWDGDPRDPGSSIVETCEVARGFWGGDIWEYDDQAGFGTPETIGDATSTIRLEFLDGFENVLGYSEPDGAATTAWERIYSENLVVPNGTERLRFTQWKRGTALAWGEVKCLQVNTGTQCCDFEQPVSALTESAGDTSSGGGGGTTEGVGVSPADVVYNPTTGDELAHVTRLWAEAAGEFVTADELLDQVDEHRQGAVNLLLEGRDERSTPSATGDQEGTPYPIVTLADVGLDPGDAISIRLEAKTEA